MVELLLNIEVLVKQELAEETEVFEENLHYYFIDHKHHMN
jgi:hypothetical protein